MHRYEPGWAEDPADWILPDPVDFTYRDAYDIAAFVALDPTMSRATYPQVWHLDHEGRWCCYSKGSSLDSVRRFAETPEQMLACRRTRLPEPCPDFWVMIEPRQRWRGDRYEPTEADAQAFASLRRALDAAGSVCSTW